MGLLSFIKQLFGNTQGVRVQSISPTEAFQHLQENVLLIDVRQPNELKSDGKVKQAKNVPLGSLSEAQLPKDKNTPIMFMCRSGARSGMAAKQAVNMGYDNVMNIQGGIMNWKRHDLPTQ